jgi:hypothetical protein
MRGLALRLLFKVTVGNFTRQKTGVDLQTSQTPTAEVNILQVLLRHSADYSVFFSALVIFFSMPHIPLL